MYSYNSLLSLTVAKLRDGTMHWIQVTHLLSMRRLDIPMHNTAPSVATPLAINAQISMSHYYPSPP
jgi:hypothetical protein